MTAPSRIAISQLGALNYCPYKIYLKEWLKKQDIKPTVIISKELIEGMKAHKKLNDEYKAKPEEEKKVVKRELGITGLRVRGRADEILFKDNIITIIDDKAHDTAYEGDKWQVYGYCLGYKQQHESELTPETILKGAIRNWKTEIIVWESEFTGIEEKIIEEKIDLLFDIYNEKLIPESTDNPGKCYKCNLRKSCDRNLWTL